MHECTLLGGEPEHAPHMIAYNRLYLHVHVCMHVYQAGQLKRQEGAG